MRHHNHQTTKRVQRNWQYQIPILVPDRLPPDTLSKLCSAFTRALPITKRWAMSADFQANVNAALEREKNEP